MTEQDEKRLAALGTPEAIAELIEGSLPDATAFVRSACRNLLPADEQQSIAGMVLMRHAETYDPRRGRLLTYLKPALLGAVRQAWRDREPVDYGPVIPERPEDDGLTDEERKAQYLGKCDPDWQSIDTRERFSAIQPHIAKLEEHERRVLILHYNGGLSFALIAKMTDVTRAAVQRTFTVALRKLRNQLMDSKLYNSLRSNPA